MACGCDMWLVCGVACGMVCGVWHGVWRVACGMWHGMWLGVAHMDAGVTADLDQVALQKVVDERRLGPIAASPGAAAPAPEPAAAGSALLSSHSRLLWLGRVYGPRVTDRRALAEVLFTKFLPHPLLWARRGAQACFPEGRHAGAAFKNKWKMSVLGPTQQCGLLVYFMKVFPPEHRVF